MTESTTKFADTLDDLYFIERHKSIFDIEPTPLLHEFEVFAAKVRDWALACACKIEGTTVLAARFYLFRTDPDPVDHRDLWDFFRRVESLPGSKLDYRWIDRFFRDPDDLANLTEIIAAIDARRDSPTLKYIVQFGKDLDYLRRAASFLGERPELQEQVDQANYGQINFELQLNGQSEMELYLGYTDLDRPDRQRLLAKWLPPIARDWPGECHQIGLGHQTDRADPVVYCVPRDPDSFAARLQSDAARRIHARYRDLSVAVPWFGFAWKNLIDRATHTVNLQYSVKFQR
jgi:LynF/TruF/PatF family peptide O-prenyltransferase